MAQVNENKVNEWDLSSTQTGVAKCPSCGANLTFNPEKQVLYCEHCGTEKAFEFKKNAEQSFAKLLEKNNTWTEETKVYSCTNCGAKEVVSRKEIAKNCSFCGTSNIVETKELSGLKPNAIVPFKISVSQAIDKAVAWAKKRFFAPGKFKKGFSTEDVSGVYNPAFTFDTQTLSTYSGRLGKNYTTTRRVNGKTVTTTQTRYFNVSGTYTMFFDDILVQAASTIPQKTIDKLQPFNTNDSKEYAQEFLHGYAASQYSKDGMQCWEDAKKIIYNRVRSGILSQYDYDVVDYINIKVDCNNITYKYLLLPLYVGHYNWRQKLYNFFVNGLNGKVTGKVPTSALKVLGVVAIALAAIAGVAALLMLL